MIPDHVRKPSVPEWPPRGPPSSGVRGSRSSCVATTSRPRSTAPRPAPRGGCRRRRSRGPGPPAADPRVPACGTIARTYPRRAASRSRRSTPGTERSSPRRPTSPTATVCGVTGRSRSDDASAIASGRSRAGSATDRPPARFAYDVVRPEAHARPPAEDRDQQRQPVGVEAARGPARACPGRPARRAPALRRATAASLRGSARRRCPALRARGRPTNARAGSATSVSPTSPISKTPISSVDPNRFFDARTSRSDADRSPSMESTASTRCSRVFGPARLPSFVTWPTRTTAIPSPFASSISRRADSRTWPTLPAGPSSSSSGRGLDGIDDEHRRPSGAGHVHDAPDLALGDDADGDSAGALEQAEPRRPQPDLRGRLLARRVEHPAAGRGRRRAASPSATWSSSVDLPMPGSPPTSTSDPGTRPTAQHAVEFAEAR